MAFTLFLDISQAELHFSLTRSETIIRDGLLAYDIKEIAKS